MRFVLYRRSFTGLLTGRASDLQTRLRSQSSSVKVPSTLLVVSPALSLLGKSSAFRVGAPDGRALETITPMLRILRLASVFRGALVARGLWCGPIRAFRTAVAWPREDVGGVRNTCAMGP